MSVKIAVDIEHVASVVEVALRDADVSGLEISQELASLKDADLDLPAGRLGRQYARALGRPEHDFAGVPLICIRTTPSRWSRRTTTARFARLLRLARAFAMNENALAVIAEATSVRRSPATFLQQSEASRLGPLVLMDVVRVGTSCAPPACRNSGCRTSSSKLKTLTANRCGRCCSRPLPRCSPWGPSSTGRFPGPKRASSWSKSAVSSASSSA
jgi:hypothetical protein